MIYGIVGSISQDRNIAIPRPSDCGNGKTNLMVYLAYQEFIQKGRKIIANFHTKYQGGNFNHSWSEYRTAQEIFERWFDDEDIGALICVTEISGIVHSAARESKTIKWVENRLNQRRKLDYDMIWDSQRWMSGDKIIRDKTDIIYVPIKFHCVFDMEANNYVPTRQCLSDNCNEKHLILVYQDVPLPPPEEELTPLLCLQSWVVGELYDTKERIDQTLHVPKESM